MATFLASEINATERDIMGATEQVQINAGYPKTFSPGIR